MTTNQKIRELQMKRLDLISQNDRYNPKVLAQEKAILKEIENLINSKKSK